MERRRAIAPALVWGASIGLLGCGGLRSSEEKTSVSGGADPGGTDDDTGPTDDTGAPPPECDADDDCREPGLEVCHPSTGMCVGCVADDDCGEGSSCNVATGWCTGCTADHHCPLGTTCAPSGVCMPGCADGQPCPSGFSCCSGQCSDLAADPDDCGECGRVCEGFPNGDGACNEGTCELAGCEPGFADCDGVGLNGCETQGECSCEPGSSQPCYGGPLGTMDEGACRAGTQQCNEFGTGYGPCEGEVRPVAEACNNDLDDDCDGNLDEDIDADGDGWTACGGDCCDVQGAACGTPELVNPGAFEVSGNGVDDDCDDAVDNADAPCDAALSSNSANAFDYVRALDLCRFTETAPPDPADRIWGVLQAELALVDGSGTPAAESRSLRGGFGTAISTRRGQRLAVLSTGHAADQTDTNPAYRAFQRGTVLGTTSDFPEDWLAANGGELPNAPGCITPFPGQGAQDPIMLTVEVRVPTNANSFSVDMFFLSAEYPEYVCSAFNDFFIALVETAAADNPDDENIAIYDAGDGVWPVGVNLVSAADGLFTACQDGDVGQCGTATSSYDGCTSSGPLAGTGFQIDGELAFDCDYEGPTGGGTGWLRMRGNVVPGEVATIRFAIWDTSDGNFDSVVLLDNWRWSVQASDPGVTPG